MNQKRFLRWLIIIVSFYLIVTTSQAIVDLWRSGDKLTNRERELAALQVQQQELTKQKKRVESQDYLEKVARNELGMSKPGEEIIIVPPELLAQSPEASPDATPNWEKWMKLLL
ncbi:septum formation initiator family protein [Candidatus Microgenomates bacterium]|nr:septum formation initiator family protein [Candidatus Microgenomates bacterium]